VPKKKTTKPAAANPVPEGPHPLPGGNRPPAKIDPAMEMRVDQIVALTQWINRNVASLRREEYTFSEALASARGQVPIPTPEAFQAILDASEANPKWKPEPPPTAAEFAKAAEVIRRQQEEIAQLRKTVADCVAKVGEVPMRATSNENGLHSNRQAADLKIAALEADVASFREMAATNAKSIGVLQKDAGVFARGYREAIEAGQKNAARLVALDELVQLNGRDIAGIDERFRALTLKTDNHERRLDAIANEFDPAQPRSVIVLDLRQRLAEAERRLDGIAREKKPDLTQV